MRKLIKDYVVEVTGLGEFKNIEFFYEFDLNNLNIVFLSHVILSNDTRTLKLTASSLELEKFQWTADLAIAEKEASSIFHQCKAIAYDQVNQIFFRHNQVNEKLFSHQIKLLSSTNN